MVLIEALPASIEKHRRRDMRNLFNAKSNRSAAMALLAGAISLGAVASAPAQTVRTGAGLGSVVSCDAAGGKQAGGAVIGALAGAAAGSNLARHDRTAGTVIGAVVGAGAGSYVGCQMQRADQDRVADVRHDEGYAPVAYGSDHHWAARMPTPVRYERHATPYVSLSTQALRAAPTLASRRVGRLGAGERFQALARVGHGDWILVGQRGVALGYVFAGNVRPLDYRPMVPVQARYDYR